MSTGEIVGRLRWLTVAYQQAAAANDIGVMLQIEIARLKLEDEYPGSKAMELLGLRA